MKKNINLFIGIFAGAIAILLFIVGNFKSEKLSVIDKYEKAMNKGNTKLMLECFAPDDRELISGMLSLNNIISEETTSSNTNIDIIQTSNQIIEDGTELKTYIVQSDEKGNIENVSVNTLKLSKVDNKFYIKY